MSNKKKSNNSIKNSSVYSIIGIFVVCFILFGIIIALRITDFKIGKKKELFKIETRVKNVEETDVFEDSSYKTIGWVRVEGTDIDYPVIYSSSKESDFPVELDSYAWSLNYGAGFHNMINIMGHNIFNLSSSPKVKSDKFKRFEELMAFSYYDFAKDNKYIQLTIGGKDYAYKIFSVGFVLTSGTTSFPLTDDYSEKEMKEHIDFLNKRSIYKYDVDVDEKDSLISLITCTRFFGRDVDYEFFVNGRLLRDGEKIEEYDVKTTDKYKDIEKILKGDGNDEEDSL